ncbi:DUF6415 family natural product biosynthesis protein [Streptomyces sp. NPDC059080]|uniref:DUF6415 family natural product biosynthesis protein n=1 Tax=Streptomyces sp. NPDC059080 TaxID=3346718 RepID=UPI00369D6A53
MSSAFPPIDVDSSAATMRQLLGRLHDAYLGEYDDDLDAVLGAAAGPEGIAGARPPQRRRLLPGLRRRPLGSPPSQAPSLDVVAISGRARRLDRLLAQLINIARARAGGRPGPGFSTAIDRADRLRTGTAAAVSTDEAHVRRMAMAAQDLLDHLEPDDAAPLPTFEPLPRELRCA